MSEFRHHDNVVLSVRDLSVSFQQESGRV